MTKIISVWLILQDGKNKNKIALQKRRAHETFSPYICQATWSGGVEPGETPLEAVKRECDEEMGSKFFKNFDFSKLKKMPKEKHISIKNKKTYEIYNYFAQTNDKTIKSAKLHRDAFSKFIFIGLESEIHPIKSNKDPKCNIVLFDDQYKVIKKILNGNKRNTK